MDITEVTTKSALVRSGIRTWVFVAPMLPMNPERLAALILPHIYHAMVDPLNYRGQVASLLRQHGWDYAISDKYEEETGTKLLRLIGEKARRV